MLKKLKLSASFLSLLFVVACGARTSGLPPYEYMPNMTNSPAIKAQEQKMRLPVEGTLSVSAHSPYPYAKDEGEKAAAELKNPVPRTKASFERGRKMFNTYCIVCHGERGLGDGTVVPSFPRPPSLQSEKVRNWNDGRIYHVITSGQNLMPSYALQIAPEDRWAIIHYVRVLHRAAQPTKEDLDDLKKIIQEETSHGQ